MNVKLFIGPEEDHVQPMRIRSLMVDGHVKEFVTGEQHEVTDRQFVMRRVYRINDALPDDPKVRTDLKWTRGGWISVNRDTGRVTQLKMAEFDPFFSVASWYRDYVAFCGSSDNGEKLMAVVRQIGVTKPVLKVVMGKPKGAAEPDSECETPVWEKGSSPKVTFTPIGGDKVSFVIHGRTGELEATAGDDAEDKQ